MSKDIKNNNEIFSFEAEENENIQNKSNKDNINIDIEQILKNEDELLKKNNKSQLEIKNFTKKEKELKASTISLREEDLEKKAQITDDIREASRRAYLNKRVNQQLDLFKRRMIDEYNIFQDIKLTKEEINNNRLNNKIYHLITKNTEIQKEIPKEKKDKNDNIDLVQRFSFKREEPEYQRKNKKTKRNNININDFKETSESLWEKEQRKKAIQKYGNVQQQNIKNKYDILIENQMEFVKQDLLESENVSLIKEGKEKIY